ncbi:MAG TPA: hypothetical protein DDZ40_06940 [Deltaproteobacteria bacterium]|nr:hypothetical protein [Deltaproteobacteria bacterium]
MTLLERVFKTTRQLDRLDKALADSLLNSSRYFTGVLGEPIRDNSGFLFPGEDGLLSSLKVSYEVDNKFLGKIYAMVVDGKVAAGSTNCSSENAELCYSGMILKGSPFFKRSRQKGNGQAGYLVKSLNQDQRILDMCKSLDTEFLRVFFDPKQGAWRIQIRPYGGSVVVLMFPPMRYKVMLPKGHAKGMYTVLKSIASVIQKL